MNARHPIYTERTECQDCYKCIRACPLKAIKVESGYASVVPELCVCCGHCVETCPHDAKKVRNDRPKVEALLAAGGPVYVSLAPSFAAEFAGVSPEQMTAALRRLGFAGVSETALGAEQVSAALSRMLKDSGPRVMLSSACPVAVEYIRKYAPAAAPLLSPVMSPMLAHARLLRREFGDGIGVVFIGPCIAKKREADDCPELVGAALTFEDLREWFRERKIQPERLAPDAGGGFVPRAAGRGGLYPVEGGMIAGIDAAGASFMSFSGMKSITAALTGLDGFRGPRPLFLELLACEGGCINGPKTSKPRALAVKRQRIADYAGSAEPPAAGVEIAREYPACPVPVTEIPEAQIREALRQVGKFSPEDDLNCGGCGYDSCREFARALLFGRAERRMCATYMRKLAEKKAYALMRKMPAGVVVVDDRLRVVECNPNFARFFAGEATPESLEGQELSSIAPFYTLFERVLRTGEDFLDRDVRFNGFIYRASIFSVEKQSLVAATFMDITEPSGRKEQIIARTREVVRRNLETVQQIAYLIGENAAESEIALNSIVESFAPEGGKRHESR